MRRPGRSSRCFFGTDRDDPPNLDFYTSAVVKYPWADDAYFMFPSAYRHFPAPPEGRLRNKRRPRHRPGGQPRRPEIPPRVARLPYVGLSPEGSPDSRGSYMFIGMLRREGMIYQYYGSHDVNHGDTEAVMGRSHIGGVFLACQRLDGFVSLDAGPGGGRFVTPPVSFRGSRLLLNMDASATGDIRVELQDAEGGAVPGFAFADSDVLYLNDIAKVATWRKGVSDVAALAGKPVRLAFRLRSAKLYAFQFGD